MAVKGNFRLVNFMR